MTSVKKKNLLVLAAHPDDETLGAGGFIHHLSQTGQYYVKLLTFTDGESSREPESALNRNSLLSRVGEILGIDEYHAGEFPDNRMDTVPLLDLCKFIEQHTQDFVPEIILTHHHQCLNVDHQLVYRATITAFRPQRGFNQSIYCYFVPSSTDYNPISTFQGTVTIELSQQNVDAKLAALKVYDAEMRPYPHTRSYDNILNLARVAGARVGLPFAESFELLRSVVTCTSFSK